LWFRAKELFAAATPAAPESKTPGLTIPESVLLRADQPIERAFECRVVASRDRAEWRREVCSSK
jgi:hypothetical protein